MKENTYKCDLHHTIIVRGDYCQLCQDEAEDAIARAATMSNVERIATFERFLGTTYLSIELDRMGALLSSLLGRQIELWEAGASNRDALAREIKAQAARPATIEIFHDFANRPPWV